MKDYNHLRNQKRNNCHDFFKILGYTYIKIFEIIINIFLIIYSYIYNESNFQYISSPKISIFLPIYNKAKYLKRSIHSIQIQTLKEIEIITVNDCSNDNSLKILKKMAEKDSRIKIVNNNKNRGLLYSRAMGILYSKGEYLMNLDPDDKLEGPDNLEYLYKKAYQSKADIVSFGFLVEINFQLIKII
jgi:glycosyltransferase involved in cell wall biosynthesis